jgi:hypothetical protein
MHELNPALIFVTGVEIEKCGEGGGLPFRFILSAFSKISAG